MKKAISLLAICFMAIQALAAEPRIINIETAGTALIMQVSDNGTVRTLHYGEKISSPGQYLSYQSWGDGNNGSGPMTFPTTGGKWLGEPALHVRYADGSHNTELRFKSVDQVRRQGVCTTSILMEDPVTKLSVTLIFDAYEDEDVIVAHTDVTNGGKGSVELINSASASLNIEGDSFLLTHFYGSWAGEMQVENEFLGHDLKVIESRRGVQATQGNNPSFMLSLDSDRLEENYGRVIAGALAWSGNFRMSFERDESGRLNILSGISPHASAWPLKAKETFTTPEMIYTWSGSGAGQASRNLHRWARKYGVYGGGRVNPTLLNSWEGAYFNFDTKTLLDMIDDAAGMGLEMFVLDDGWFGNAFPRNADNAGLGDWEVNVSKLPEGIDHVASYAHDKGLKFGIWIEPEMVNPDSELAHRHPEWAVKSPGRELYLARTQWVLDLSNPQVQDFVFGVFDRTMSLSDKIDYIKWDCNRTICSFGSAWEGEQQDKFYIEYCQGLYKVMRRIREKYPSVIIQCCSSGGGRVDYGSLRYCNEFWTSDNNDALSRTFIQYGTDLIYPPFATAAHVGAVPSHQTGNITPLKFRFDVACSGRLGLELQPKNLRADEKALAERCIKSYYGYRDLVFEGDLYRLASPYDGEYYALMYVSRDKSRAVVFVCNLNYRAGARGGQTFRLQGLDPDATYKVTEQNVDSSCWWGDGGVFTGDFLSAGGFNPVLQSLYSSAVFLLEKP